VKQKHSRWRCERLPLVRDPRRLQSSCENRNGRPSRRASPLRGGAFVAGKGSARGYLGYDVMRFHSRRDELPALRRRPNRLDARWITPIAVTNSAVLTGTRPIKQCWRQCGHGTRLRSLGSRKLLRERVRLLVGRASASSAREMNRSALLYPTVRSCSLVKCGLGRSAIDRGSSKPRACRD
jgi:hypothetical protein